MTTPDAAGRSGSFDVVSTDGTAIKVWFGGKGPSIVLVHGSLRDHRIFEPLIAQLQSEMTTYAVDRRGFGGSGDRDGYSIEQEFRDVATVLDAVAARTGPVALWGHSYGAGCAMGASTLTGNVSHLILYEPGLGIAYAPGWPEYLSAARTVLREARTENDWVYQPGTFDGIHAATLMPIGTETSPALMRSTLQAVAAISGARTHVLGGHGHLARTAFLRRRPATESA